VPDRGGQGEQALSDAGADALAGPAAVAFEPELAFEGVEHRLDPLPEPAEVAVAGAFVASVRTQHADSQRGDLASISRPARPLSARTVEPGRSRPVSTAIVSRSRQTSRSPIFGSARHQAIGIPSGAASR
jgi:hypothetical protein